MKKQLLILAALATMSAAQAAVGDTFTKKNITYQVTVAPPDEMSVGEVNVAHADYTGDVSVPKAVQNGYDMYYVTGIGEGAFKDCTGLTSVTLSNKIKTIGDEAFVGCTSLSVIDLSAAMSASYIPTVSATAFDESAYAKVLVFADSDEMAEALKASDGWKNFANIVTAKFVYNNVQYAFNPDMTVTASYEPDENGKCVTAGDVVIPEQAEYNGQQYTVTKIDAYGFPEWYYPDTVSHRMTSISIPATVTEIGRYAFAANMDIKTSLTAITVNWATPLAVSESDNLFKYISDEELAAITLYVPQGTKDAYAAADVWKKFNIVEQQPTGIATATATERATVAGIYTLGGAKLSRPQRGIVVVRMSDGTSRKVLVK